MNRKGIRWLYSELPKLVGAGVVDEVNAERLKEYYGDVDQGKGNLFFVLFGILGSLLIGCGIISLLAHNWDQFPRGAKLVLAFSPLLVGQGCAGYALVKKSDSRTWLESSSTFLTLAIAAAIALVGQIYHVPGNLANFMLAWMILTIPLIFLLKSTATSSIYTVCLIVWTFSMAGDHRDPVLYWFLLIPLVAIFIQYFKTTGASLSTRLIGWLIAVIVPITLYPAAEYGMDNEELLLLAYVALFGAFYCLGNMWVNSKNPFRFYSFSLVGLGGVVVTSLVCSFADIWNKLDVAGLAVPVNILLLIIAGVCYALCIRRKVAASYMIGAFPFLFAICLGLSELGAYSSSVCAVLINLYTLSLGIYSIVIGVRSSAIGKVNFGMLLISLLVLTRFFDSDIGFVLRGVVFIILGCGFMATNFVMVHKKKNQSSFDSINTNGV